MPFWNVGCLISSLYIDTRSHTHTHTHVHMYRHTSWLKRTNVECKLVDLLTHNWSSKCQCNRSLLANSGEVVVNGGAAEN